MPTPTHVPCVEVSVEPRCAVPETVGAAVLTGGAPLTTAVGALGTLTVPSGFDAVTFRRT